MTDRDRLIGLIADIQNDFEKWCVECAEDGHKDHQPLGEYLVDKLLANGVIVPVRCKDCKHFIPYEMLDHTEYPNEIEADGVCDNIDKYTDIDHFCYYGKLKEREQNG